MAGAVHEGPVRELEALLVEPVDLRLCEHGGLGEVLVQHEGDDWQEQHRAVDSDREPVAMELTYVRLEDRQASKA